MLKEEHKNRIRLYSTIERSRLKAERRHADAAEVARGNAEDVQERNRVLPHVSHLVFSDKEENIPTE